MKNSRGFLLGIVLVFIFTGSSMALSVDDNITIYDGWGYSGLGVGYEDNETETGMINNQNWDLEAFFLNGYDLAMVGGFNFQSGYNYNNHLYEAGDIFIDVGHTGKYDYVLDMDYAGAQYSIYDIRSGYSFVSCSEASNVPYSDPYRYDAGGSLVGSDLYSIIYELDLSDSEVGGLLGGTHNAVGVNLAFLGEDINNVTIHSTLSCGNDNLMARTAPAPEPATMLLFGCGLVGMAVFGRKKFINQT